MSLESYICINGDDKRMQKWLPQIEGGDVKYACWQCSRGGRPRISKEDEQTTYALTCPFPGEEGICAPLSPSPGVFQALTLAFAQQAFGPLSLGAGFPRGDTRQGLERDANLRPSAWASQAALVTDAGLRGQAREGRDVEDREMAPSWAGMKPWD